MIVCFEISGSKCKVDRFIYFSLCCLSTVVHALCELKLCRPVRIFQRSERYTARTLRIGKKSVANIDSDMSDLRIAGSFEKYHIAELHFVLFDRSPKYRLHRCRSRKIDSKRFPEYTTGECRAIDTFMAGAAEYARTA